MRLKGGRPSAVEILSMRRARRTAVSRVNNSVSFPNTLAPIVIRNELLWVRSQQLAKLAQTLHASGCRLWGQLWNVKLRPGWGQAATGCTFVRPNLAPMPNSSTPPLSQPEVVKLICYLHQSAIQSSALGSLSSKYGGLGFSLSAKMHNIYFEPRTIIMGTYCIPYISDHFERVNWNQLRLQVKLGWEHFSVHSMVPIPLSLQTWLITQIWQNCSKIADPLHNEPLTYPA